MQDQPDNEDSEREWGRLADYDGKEFYIQLRFYPMRFVHHQKGWRGWVWRVRSHLMRFGMPYIRLPWEWKLTGITDDHGRGE